MKESVGKRGRKRKVMSFKDLLQGSVRSMVRMTKLAKHYLELAQKAEMDVRDIVMSDTCKGMFTEEIERIDVYSDGLVNYYLIKDILKVCTPKDDEGWREIVEKVKESFGEGVDIEEASKDDISKKNLATALYVDSGKGEITEDKKAFRKLIERVCDIEDMEYVKLVDELDVEALGKMEQYTEDREKESNSP